ncbi:hypothetical protein [Nocardioides coralli]|uniref:hypothetical protein n=1 Tax=Nocardioides coralli TaxID=2872154 RepID=UPI001CA3C09F|nr:hypothetical protein [Nocardioides coralli]QZY28676.1 hypothetical protein K6T13_14605 [Nocardioides coralli]
MDHRLFLAVRAQVLADLHARGRASVDLVSALEDAVEARRWWAEQWPEGEVYVAGLVAQDVQDAAVDAGERWPVCRSCGEAPEHALHIHPDLGGPDPVWVCEESGVPVAGLGRLSPDPGGPTT